MAKKLVVNWRQEGKVGLMMKGSMYMVSPTLLTQSFASLPADRVNFFKTFIKNETKCLWYLGKFPLLHVPVSQISPVN